MHYQENDVPLTNLLLQTQAPNCLSTQSTTYFHCHLQALLHLKVDSTSIDIRAKNNFRSYCNTVKVD